MQRRRFEPRRRGHEQRRLIAEGEAHAAVVRSESARTDPHDLARGAERVEVRRAVLGQPGRQDVGLEHRSRKRRSLKHAEHLDQAVDPPAGSRHALPRRQEAGERLTVDRLHLTAQGRRASDAGAGAGRRRRTTPVRLRRDGTRRARLGRRASSRSSAGRTRSMGTPKCAATCPARNGPWVRAKRATRSSNGASTGSVNARRQSDRQSHPERVSQAGGVLGRGDPLLAGHDDAHRPPLLRRDLRPTTRAATPSTARASRSTSDSGPSSRRRSCSSSASRARRPSVRCCSSSSRSASTTGSSRSRSSSAPSRSRNSSRSRARAAARRSANGASPSYM